MYIEREPWMCADCFDQGIPTPGFASHQDGEVCGYHHGVRKGYIADDSAETGGNADR